MSTSTLEPPVTPPAHSTTAGAAGSRAAPERARPLAGLWPVFVRELGGYFLTPVAYVFIVIFLLLTGVFTFSDQMGAFFERGQADLRSFFNFHPWLYLFLVPAVSMRLWSEERRQGTIELLLTLPVSLPAAVLGKFLAAWAFCGIALGLTFPVWITVNYLGRPDNGVIFAAYLGSLLLAGGFLAVGSAISAVTRNQVIAFVVTVTVCFALLLAGFDPVIQFFRGWAPQPVVDAIASFSFLTRFESISKGVIDLRDLVYSVSLIALCLLATGVIVEAKKAG
jgi:ABC-2 type transport system permease protein